MRIVEKKRPTENEFKKILLMGLANSGKTTILQNLRGIRNLPSYFKGKPTLGRNIVNFQALESDFTVWDFGGQESYIKKYLDKFSDYIKGANKLIFVIDIQDPENYAPSLDYLEKIVKQLEKHDSSIDLSVFLHKYDPDLEVNKPKKDEFNDLIKEIKQIFPLDFNYEICFTSIYAMFEKTNIE